MKEIKFPIDCNCKIHQVESGINKGLFEINLYNLPHNFGENKDFSIQYYGKTIEDALFNMYQYFPEALNREVLDSSAQDDVV